MSEIIFKAIFVCWGIMLSVALYTSFDGGFSQKIEKKPNYTQDDKIYCEYVRKNFRSQDKVRICYKFVRINYKE
jgi:hypothetical protein